MQYIRIKKDCESCKQGELFTKKEVEKIKARFEKSRLSSDYSLLLDISRNGESVNINKNKVFYFFGCRFAE